MRKILIAILCLCLLTALAVPAFAAGTLKLSLSNTTVHRGDTFTVTVSVSGVEANKRGGISVSYNSKFTLTKGEWLVQGASFTEFDVGDKVGTFVYSDSKTLSGNVFRFTFKANSDAKFESGDITVKFTLGTAGSGPEISATTKVTVACNHKFGSFKSISSTQHSRTCSVCGTVDKGSHTYDNDCDTDCNACGATRTITHSYGTEWTSDETGHYHACATCGDKADVDVHNPGAPAGEYTDQTCTVCNFVLAPALGHVHKYDDTYLTDAEGHWQKCLGESCGEETEAQPHIFKDDCDTGCDTCAYERTVLHKEGTNWQTSTQAHWKVCTNCQERLEQSDHIWGNGTVLREAALNQPGQMEYHCGICNARWVDAIPALTLTQALAWWIWVLIGMAGGIVLTVGVGLAIILPKTLRKSKGRFSH